MDANILILFAYISIFQVLCHDTNRNYNVVAKMDTDGTRSFFVTTVPTLTSFSENYHASNLTLLDYKLEEAVAAVEGLFTLISGVSESFLAEVSLLQFSRNGTEIDEI